MRRSSTQQCPGYKGQSCAYGESVVFQPRWFWFEGLHRRRVLPREFLDWARGPQWLTSQHPREVQGLAFLSQGRPARSTSVPTDLDTQTFSSVPPPNHRPPLRVAVGDAECSNYNRCDHALLLAPGTTPRRGQLIDKLGSLGFSQPYLSVFPPEENRPGSSAVPRRFRTGIQGMQGIRFKFK